MSGVAGWHRAAMAVAVGVALSAVPRSGESVGAWPTMVEHPDEIGEWTGIAPDADLLLTLRVSPEPTKNVLVLTRHHRDEVVTEVYAIGAVTVTQRVFHVGQSEGAIQLDGCLRNNDPGWGEGLLTRRGRDGSSAVMVYFFRRASGPWVADVLRAYRAEREVPPALAEVPQPLPPGTQGVHVSGHNNEEVFVCPATRGARPRAPATQPSTEDEARLFKGRRSSRAPR